MIYEVEVIHYTDSGVIRLRETDLFYTSKQAISCMREKLAITSLIMNEKLRNRTVKLVDDNGVLRQSIKIGIL